MSRLIYISIRAILVIFVIIILIQPFNLFCQTTGACSPFFISYYLPKIGDDFEIKAIFEVTSYKKDLEISIDKTYLETSTNEKILVTYKVKNNSKNFIKFKPELVVEPKYVEKYLVRYQCPCSRVQKVNGEGGETEFKAEFLIKNDIGKEKEFKGVETIIIRYKF